MNSENRPQVGLPTGVLRPEGEAGVLLDGRYRLGDLIGRGGTAQVHRGRDELLGRDVAVKVFDIQLTDLNTVARQRSEMRALAALSDPHLVAVHDARLVESSAGATTAERSYLVMELVNGGTLAERLHGGPMEPRALRPIAVAVASGLAAAHEHGLVHRDVKPANVLIAESGAVKLGDFGLARMVATETPLTSGSMLAGTAAYFSPEQAGGEHVGAPTDIYALGLVLLEAVSGRREFPGAPVPSAMARLLRDPEIPDGLPAPWPTLLLRMTDRDPAARPTAAEVVRILSESASPVAPARTDAAPTHPGPVPISLSESPERHDEPVTAAGSSVLSAFLRPEGEQARRARRRTSLLVGAGVLLSAVVLTVVITVSGENPPPADASTVVVQSDSSGAVSTRSPAARTTAGTSPNSRTSGSRSAGSRTAGNSVSSAQVTGVPPVRSATSAPLRTSTAPVVVVRATSTPLTTRLSTTAPAPVTPVQAPPSPAAADNSAAKDAAKNAAAASRSAEKAADAARRAAEKQQKEAAKNAPGAGKPGKSGKKP